jgi:hypothetical protein
MTQQPHTGPWMRQYVEWRDRRNRTLHGREVVGIDADVSIPSEDQGSSHDLPAFEKVTIFHFGKGKVRGGRFGDMESDSDSEFEQPLSEAVKLKQTFSAASDWFKTDQIRIYSTTIINALRSVIQYYPQQDLSDNIIKMNWPYPVLVHHYDDLVRLRSEHTGKDPKEVCVRDRDMDRHMDLLISFLDKEVMPMVEAEKERHKRGRFTFDFFWVALKPGRTIFHKIAEAKDVDEWEVGVIHTVSGGVFKQPREDWKIEKWSLAYDGMYLGRQRTPPFMFSKFDGEATFDHYHMQVFGQEEFKELAKEDDIRETVEKGRIYWDLVDKGCMYHRGKTVESPRNEVRLCYPELLNPCLPSTRLKDWS